MLTTLKNVSLFQKRIQNVSSFLTVERSQLKFFENSRRFKSNSAYSPQQRQPYNSEYYNNNNYRRFNDRSTTRHQPNGYQKNNYKPNGYHVNGYNSNYMNSRPTTNNWQRNSNFPSKRTQYPSNDYKPYQPNYGRSFKQFKPSASRFSEDSNYTNKSPPRDYTRPSYDRSKSPMSSQYGKYSRMDNGNSKIHFKQYYSKLNELKNKGKLREMMKLFQELKGLKGNNSLEIAYGTILDGFSRHGLTEELLGIYKEMKVLRIPLNNVIFSILIKGVGGNLRDINYLLREMVQHRIPLNEITCNSLVEGYIGAGAQEQLNSLINYMIKSSLMNTHIYTTIINAYGAEGNYERMDYYVNKMVQDEIPFTCQTYTITINYYGKFGKTDKVYKYAQQMIEQEQCNLHCINALLQALLYCRQFKDLRVLIEELNKVREEFDTVTYNTLLKIYVHLGDSNSFENLFKEMNEKRNINTASISTATFGYTTFNMDKTEVIGNTMEQFNIKPDDDIYKTKMLSFLHTHNFPQLIQFLADFDQKDYKIPQNWLPLILVELRVPPHLQPMLATIKEFGNSDLEGETDRLDKAEIKFFLDFLRQVYEYSPSSYVKSESVYSHSKRF